MSLLREVCGRALRFGAFLVSRELAELGDVITVFFSILIGAFYLGQSGPNMQKLAEAQAAAATIYKVIDTVRTLCVCVCVCVCMCVWCFWCV